MKKEEVLEYLNGKYEEMVELVDKADRRSYRPPGHENDPWCAGVKTPDCDLCSDKENCKHIWEIRRLLEL